jgi:hypothetical protein
MKLVRNREARLPVTAEWIAELSAERYRPMLKLLDSREVDFLRSQPGYTRAMGRKLRAQRCQVFRGYLRSLETDFYRTCAALKLVLVRSGHDRQDLASAIIRAQTNFAAGVFLMRMRMVLYRIGLASVDVRPLVQLFDGMQLELRALVPSM